MITGLGLVALVTAIAVNPQVSSEPSADSLLRLLRTGGYTVIVRHTHTDRSVQEPMGSVPADRALQRNLSEQGVADAKLMGAVIAKAKVPFGEIVSSPMFRTMETAEHAFGKPAITMLLRTFEPSPEQLALIVKAPMPGTNRVLVTHHFVIERYAPTIRPGDIDEGEAVVVRTSDNQTLALVGRFKLADWRRIGGREAAAPDAGQGEAGRGKGASATAAPHSTYPASHPGGDGPAARIVHGYLRAFNSGDAETMRAFLESTMVADPNRPILSRVEIYKTLFAEHGPFSVVSDVAATPGEASLKVRSRQGEFTLSARADSVDIGRARSVTLSKRVGGHP